ncbi:MAG: hypothetical protein AAGA03_10075 [Planctomycetota bacterium]
MAVRTAVETRFERQAIKQARVHLNRKDTGPNEVPASHCVSVDKVARFKDFEYANRQTERELMQAISQAWLQRIESLPYSDTFDAGSGSVRLRNRTPPTNLGFPARATTSTTVVRT